ncbi:hypothetical protein SKAU_G00302530 [Synaphobranchus kaupii]|uniref:Uncharacterized protein n=1 Tax=Synaphobranchus kaupii TaxID=118154 RepID=A0A9Q1ILB3_SYNKA|nr:hypothetical protein SKAU_G00302530 [Synaphobranchus kaupii]
MKDWILRKLEVNIDSLQDKDIFVIVALLFRNWGDQQWRSGEAIQERTGLCPWKYWRIGPPMELGRGIPYVHLGRRGASCKF